MSSSSSSSSSAAAGVESKHAGNRNTASHRFTLSTTLGGHDEAIRDIAFIGNDIIAVAASAGQMAVWQREDDRQFHRKAVFPERVHAGLTFCVEPVHAPGFVDTFISGGNDKVAKLWTAHGSIIGELKGHTDCVNSVSFTPQGQFVTGSWDGTMKVWSKPTVCLHSIPAGTKATEVLCLPTGEIVTGSTNKAINIYRDYKLVKTINNAHAHAIKKLVVHPLGFASCGNDGFVKVWSNAGEQLMQIQAHQATGKFDAYCYGVCVLPNNDLASCGEDGSVRIWSAADGTLLQAIRHPGPVRAVKVMPNGDLITACNDRSVRIFTREPDRVATDEEVQQFENFVQQTIAANFEAMDLSTLPGEEELLTAGRRDGDIKVVNSNGKAVAYKWVQAEKRWDIVGEVMGKSKKTVHNGVEYDVVSTIYVEQTPLKLAFNRDDDPHVVAKQFMDKHHLPDYLKEEIVNHVAGQVDMAAVERKKKRLEESALLHLPCWVSGPFQTFGGVKSDAMKTALLKSNKELSDAKSEHALTAEELITLEKLILNIQDASNYHISAFTDPECQLMLRLLRWPCERVLPVLDAYRVLMLHQDANKKLGCNLNVLSLLISCANHMEASHHHVTLVLKALTNWMAKRIKTNQERQEKPVIPDDVNKYVTQAVEGMAGAASHDHQGVLHAYIFFAHNVIRWFGRLGVSDSELVMMVASGVFEALERVQKGGKAETQFYALLTIGSMGLCNKASKKLVLEAFGDQLEPALKIAKTSNERLVLEVAGEVSKVFNPPVSMALD